MKKNDRWKMYKTEKTLKFSIRCLLMFVLALFFFYHYTSIDYAFWAIKEVVGYDAFLSQHVSAFFIDDVFEKAYNGYQMQRLFPFALINLLYHLLGIPINNSTLIIGANTCVFISVLVSLYFFFRISNFFKWNINTELIAFSIFFFNIHTLRLIVESPWGTDEFAFVLSIMMLFFFVQKRKALLLFSGVIGAFVWPTLFLTSLALYCMSQSPVEFATSRSKLNNYVIKGLKVVGSLIPLFILLLTYYKYAPSYTLQGLSEIYAGEWYNYNYISLFVVIISLIGLGVFIFRMLSPLQFDLLAALKSFGRSVKLRNCVWACLLFFLLKIVMWSLQNDDHYWDTAGMLKHTVLRSTALPFTFLQAHLLYYGGVIIVLLFNWKKIFNQYSQWGWGYLIVISMFMILCLNSESRYMIYLLPFMVVPLMNIVDKYNLKSWVPIAFIILQLLFSRFWMSTLKEIEIINSILPFSFEHYNMNTYVNGAFQHLELYLFGITVLIVGIGLYKPLLKRAIK